MTPNWNRCKDTGGQDQNLKLSCQFREGKKKKTTSKPVSVKLLEQYNEQIQDGDFE